MERENTPRPCFQYIKFNPQMINSMDMPFVKVSTDNQSSSKLTSFRKRLDAFKTVSTYEEAQELLQKTIPVKLDRTTLYIGNAKCVIINTHTQVRICFDSPQEMISYDFVKQ